MTSNITPNGYTLFQGYAHLSSGLACGLSGLAAGMAIGIIGDAGVRANAQQPKLFVGMVLMLIFERFPVDLGAVSDGFWEPRWLPRCIQN